MYKITAIDNKVIFNYNGEKVALIRKSSMIIYDKILPKVIKDLESSNSILVQKANRFDLDMEIHTKLSSQQIKTEVVEKKISKKESKPVVEVKKEETIVEDVKSDDDSEDEETTDETGKTTRRRKSSK